MIIVNEREVIIMMNFILGMLVMYLVSGVVVFLCDCFCFDNPPTFILWTCSWWIMIPIAVLSYFWKSLIKGTQVPQSRFDSIIRDCNFIVKKLPCNYYLMRMYGSKELHPILYHFITLSKVIIYDDSAKNRFKK